MSLQNIFGRNKSVLILLFAGIVFSISSCSLFADESIMMDDEYEITKGACGTLLLQEQIDSNFDKAFQEYEKEKRDYYLSYCPDEPCRELTFEFYEIEVKSNPGVSFRAIRILDKQNGTLVQSVSDVISSNGYHYKIEWCPEAPPVVID